MVKAIPVNEKEVVEFYLQPHPIKATCKHFHIGERRLRKILEQHDVQMRKPGEHSKKYAVDKQFFITPSKELGYFLGLLASDGCVENNDNVVYIELQEQDFEILEKLRDIMHLERPIKFYTTKRGYKSAKLYFEDKEIKQIIISQYHIPPRKTYDSVSFYFPKQELPREYWKDYIRGLFDGDGSVKLTGNTLTFQIDSSCLSILKDIQSFIKEELDVNLKITEQKPSESNTRTISLYRLYCYSVNAEKVLNYLYEDSELFLKRKKNKFIELKGDINGN